MHPSRLMLAIASVTLMACKDVVAPTPPLMTETLGQIVGLDGVVKLNPTGTPRFVLQLIDGQIVALHGEEAGWLGAVVGAEVLVVAQRTGAYKADVLKFEVLSVFDVPARDGVLVRTEAGGYQLELIGGSQSAVIDPADDLKQLVGSRVWVAGPQGARPFAFGIIK